MRRKHDSRSLDEALGLFEQGQREAERQRESEVRLGSNEAADLQLPGEKLGARGELPKAPGGK